MYFDAVMLARYYSSDTSIENSFIDVCCPFDEIISHDGLSNSASSALPWHQSIHSFTSSLRWNLSDIHVIHLNTEPPTLI